MWPRWCLSYRVGALAKIIDKPAAQDFARLCAVNFIDYAKEALEQLEPQTTPLAVQEKVTLIRVLRQLSDIQNSLKEPSGANSA